MWRPGSSVGVSCTGAQLSPAPGASTHRSSGRGGMSTFSVYYWGETQKTYSSFYSEQLSVSAGSPRCTTPPSGSRAFSLAQIRPVPTWCPCPLPAPLALARAALPSVSLDSPVWRFLDVDSWLAAPSLAFCTSACSGGSSAW